MIKIFRRFTQFQKINLGEQYLPKTGSKDTKDQLTLDESAQAMKEKFGQDYVSPFEKYDLHLPRTQVYGGPKSMEERLHQKNDYKIFRNLFKFMLVFSILYTGFILNSIKKSAKQSEEDKRQFLINAASKQLILEKFADEFERRKKISEELKKSS